MKLIKLGFFLYLLGSIFLLNAFGQTAPPATSLVTFAQFIEQTGGQDFIFDAGSRFRANFLTASAGSPVFFRYQNINNLDVSLQGFQNARLYLDFQTNAVAQNLNGLAVQPFNGTMQISILRDTPAPVGTGDRTNLLTILISPNTQTPVLSGTSGGNAAVFSATTPDHFVTFTSDFVNFSQTVQRNAGLSFSSVIPSLQTGSYFLNSFTAAGTGTFASNPPPTVILPPTAAQVPVSGRVRTASGKSLAQVALTLLDLTSGQTLQTSSDSKGNFRFPAVEVGRVFLLRATKNGYTFSEQIIEVQDEITDLTVIAESEPVIK